jgi:hypothetical protein
MALVLLGCVVTALVLHRTITRPLCVRLGWA